MFHTFCNKGIYCEDIEDFEILVELAELYCALYRRSRPWLNCSCSSGWLMALSGATMLSNLWNWHTSFRLDTYITNHDAFVHLVGIIADQKHDFWKLMKREELPEAVRSQVI
jgi:hypothetical protein